MFDSGITTLNLAISGTPDMFARPGNTVSYIGQSNVGKTVLALTTMAASFYRYGHRPLFYAMEPNVMIDIERLYGKKFAKALEVVSDRDMTLEVWQKDVRARFTAAKKPLMVTLDSTDALKCEADVAALDGKSTAKKKVSDTEEDEKKASKAQRAAAASAWSKSLSEICRDVGANGGLLILTSQVRTNPGVMFGSPYYRSCGAALDYFSEIRVWMWPSTHEKVDDVDVGGWTRIEVKRNKVTGDARTIFAPIYPSYGIDDVRAMLHFLADTESGARWVGKELHTLNVGGIKKDGEWSGGQTMTLAEMAAFYDTDSTREVLKQMVVEAWQAREAKIRAEVLAGRKPRFA